MTVFSRNRRVFKSRLDQLKEIRRWVREGMLASGFDERAIGAVELAVTEATANVIKHGYDGDDQQQIRISVIIDDEKVRLTIRDSGRAFDPTTYPPPDLDTPKAGGYGIYLINQLMDEVSYDNLSPSGARLTMVKRRSASVG